MKHRMFTCYWDDKTEETTIKFSDKIFDIPVDESVITKDAIEILINEFHEHLSSSFQLMNLVDELTNDPHKRADFLKTLRGPNHV